MSKHRQKLNRQNRGTQTSSLNALRDSNSRDTQRVSRQGASQSQPAQTDHESSDFPFGKNLEQTKNKVLTRLSTMKGSVQKELSTDFDAARRNVHKAGEAALNGLKKNPAPIALTTVGVACVGAGVTWLMMNRESVPSQPSNGQTRTSKLSRVAKKSSASARRMERSFEEIVKEHPLAVGAGLVVLATGVGLAIPR